MKGTVRRYYDIQKLRIMTDNGIGAIDRGDAPNEERDILEYLSSSLKAQEKELSAFVDDRVREHPMHEWLYAIKGIGPMMSAALISSLGSCEDFPSISKVWKYAGLHTICPECTTKKTITDKDGEEKDVKFPHPIGKDGTCPECGSVGMAARRRAGVRSDWNPFLQRTCWLIGESFVKGGKFYRGVYDRYREQVENSHPDWPNGRKHATAKRKTVKVFLSHYWAVGRGEKLDPWIISHGKHKDLIDMPEPEKKIRKKRKQVL